MKRKKEKGIEIKRRKRRNLSGEIKSTIKMNILNYIN